MEIIDGIIIGSVGGAFAGLAVYIATYLHEKNSERIDKNTIYKWMKDKTQKDGLTILKTNEIASYCNLTEGRVNYICSIHPHIYMWVGKAEDKWSLHDDIARGKKELKVN